MNVGNIGGQISTDDKELLFDGVLPFLTVFYGSYFKGLAMLFRVLLIPFRQVVQLNQLLCCLSTWPSCLSLLPSLAAPFLKIRTNTTL